VPQGFLHWIENTGDSELHFLVVLSHAEPETIELSEMLGEIPRSTLAKVLHISEELLEGIPTEAVTIGIESMM
jgi:oxalate decarboxylase/phosphoglucose isomerase-like protein (cupin superfamily)